MLYAVICVPGQAACRRANSPVSRSACISASMASARSARSFGIGDAEPFAGRRLQRHGERGAAADEPGDYREQLDDEADASGFEIVDRVADPGVRIIADVRDVALREKLPRHRIRGVALLDAGGEPAQVRGRGDMRRLPDVDGDALVELEVGPREQHRRRALRRDRRAGNHRIAGPLGKRCEDAVEVLAGIGERLELEREPPAHRPHQLDVEAGGGAAVHDVERRVGIGRQDGEDAGLAGADHVTFRSPVLCWRPPCRSPSCRSPSCRSPPRWRS
jgi:hypothetical protein